MVTADDLGAFVVLNRGSKLQGKKPSASRGARTYVGKQSSLLYKYVIYTSTRMVSLVVGIVVYNYSVIARKFIPDIKKLLKLL